MVLNKKQRIFFFLNLNVRKTIIGKPCKGCKNKKINGKEKKNLCG
jgi:hypothetical protein